MAQCILKHVWRKPIVVKVKMRMRLFDINIIECIFICKSLSHKSILFNYNSVWCEEPQKRKWDKRCGDTPLFKTSAFIWSHSQFLPVSWLKCLPLFVLFQRQVRTLCGLAVCHIYFFIQEHFYYKSFGVRFILIS